ncbi:MAG: DUF6438 domain-containing protein [Saprospiraceae bacterium]|nr:DUF6438 domain-containing protein [Saprospiraceae bacterium]
MKHSFFFLLLAAIVVACTPQNTICAQQPTAPAPGSAGNLIQLETGGCRGYCPMYKLTFRNDGVLEYFGIRHVEKMGAVMIRLSTEEFSQILKEVRKVDLWQYPAEIPSTVVDAPVHTYTVFEGGKTHSVKGTAGIPKPIMALETLMQDITEAHGIAVRKGAESKVTTAQVIVKFNMDVNAKQFCAQFTDLTVRTVTHLSEDNTWVIGFKSSELTEEQFIGLLKDMDGVLAVEANTQVKDRN